MPRTIGKLTALKVKSAKPGMHGDGGGLYLQVGPARTKSWSFRFMLKGRSREMGLGPIGPDPQNPLVSLAEARQKAHDCRRLLVAGIDPIEARDDDRARFLLEANRAKTFNDCANAYIEAHRAGWRNPKHAEQWRSTLDTYVGPVFGLLPVREVDVALVTRVLEPIWTTKTETASRVRGRIEAILDWAKTKDYRSGENPARWRGHLENLLPKRSKVRRVAHHPALPYHEIGAFMAKLRNEEGVAARALEFLILCAARTSEVIDAVESEIDGSLWTVPAGRIKGGKAHRVPLSDRALQIVQQMKPMCDGAYVFPGGRKARPLSNNAMLKLLERMERSDLTVHGFRSTFRDWAAEQTNFPREVAEMALAHVIDDKVEAAYRRGDLLEKRRQLMDAWARYCGTSGQSGNIVPIRGVKSGKR
jgi:integrase